ncbi:MAG: hypothetical protein AAFV53_17320 [Myxococcota bacterium]
MSDEPTIVHHSHPTDDVPGCGVAAYGMLLILFFLLGIGGMTLSSLALLQAGGSAGPTRLMSGREVSVWRLQPMRDAGLLELTEVPAAWHDETMSGNGTEACALTQDAVLRVESPQGWAIGYERITDVKLIDQERLITVEIYSNTGEILRCFFNPKEGGDRLARMIKSEAGLIERR